MTPSRTRGCSRDTAGVTAGKDPSDRRRPATHTVYVADDGAGSTGTVSVFDDRTCNATDHAGCATISTLHVPAETPTGSRSIPPPTRSTSRPSPAAAPTYLGVQRRHLQRSRHAWMRTDARDRPSEARARADTRLKLAMNQGTNTIYATNVLDTERPPPYRPQCFRDQRSHLRRGRYERLRPDPSRSNGRPPASGSNPLGSRSTNTDTIYTANHAGGEFPGTVSVINGATCNGQTPPAATRPPPPPPASAPSASRSTREPTTSTCQPRRHQRLRDRWHDLQRDDTAGCAETQTEPTVGDYPARSASTPRSHRIRLRRGRACRSCHSPPDPPTYATQRIAGN